MRAMLRTLNSDVLLEITIGAALAVLAYSSLAVVLLVAAMASSGAGAARRGARAWCSAPTWAAACSRVLTTAKAPVAVRQVTVGNLVFKLLGVAIAAPFVGLWLRDVRPVRRRRHAARWCCSTWPSTSW